MAVAVGVGSALALGLGGDGVSVGGGVGIGPRLGSMWSGVPTMAKTRSMKKTRT